MPPKSSWEGMWQDVVVILVLVLSAVTLVSVLCLYLPVRNVLGRAADVQVTITPAHEVDLRLVQEALAVLEEHYYSELPERQRLLYGAIQGMCGELDPYTRHLPPPQRAAERGVLAGRSIRYGTVGLWVIKEGESFVVKPIAGSAAAQADVKEGEILVRVEGQSLNAEMSTGQVRDLLRGEEGTTVAVTCRRPDGTEHAVELARGQLEEPSVLWMRLHDELGLIAVSTFTEQTPDELEQAMRALQGVGGLILDLRESPGGLLSAAVETAGCFLERALVCCEEKREGEPVAYHAVPREGTTDVRLVVLVGRNTMSAAEILAVALKENGRAILIGEPTSGKRMVQRAYDLSDGSCLHVTESIWLTAGGQRFDTGIAPDVEVQGEGAQLAEAMGYLREKAYEQPQLAMQDNPDGPGGSMAAHSAERDRTRRRLRRLRRYQGLSLESKIRYAGRLVEAALLVARHPVVCWSGGKDSTVLLHLALQFEPQIDVTFNDTGVEFPETRKFVERLAEAWNLNLHVTRPPPGTFWECVEKYGWPIGGKGKEGIRKRAASIRTSDNCCYYCKRKPAETLYKELGIDCTLLGSLAGESKRRRFLWVDFGDFYYQERRKLWTVHPLSIWLEEDVWGYHERHALPHNPLYEMGHDRVGCWPCLMDWAYADSHLSRLRGSHPRLWRFLIVDKGLGEELVKLRLALSQGQADLFSATWSIEQLVEIRPCFFDRV